MSGRTQSSEKAEEGPMAPLIRFMLRLKQVLDWSGRVIAAVSLCALFIVLLVNVVLRYFSIQGSHGPMRSTDFCSRGLWRAAC